MKSKFGRFGDNYRNNYPILLAKDSYLTTKILEDIHRSMLHSGAYAMLTAVRGDYYLQQPFSTVRKSLRSCVTCKMQNARSVKYNQNSYREFRVNPRKIPFDNIFIDHMGPFITRDTKNNRNKTYVLVITCVWSRAVNLVVCPDMSTQTFLRTFQRHIYERGCPSRVTSDLASQLTNSSRILNETLNTPSVANYLRERGIENFNFDHYAKGHSQLGSLVESAVRLTKKLLRSAVGHPLKLFDFEVLISQAQNIVNKRPISQKEALRDSDPDSPIPITPELLLFGRDLATPDVMRSPSLREITLNSDIEAEFSMLESAREKLTETYEEERRETLLRQATDKPNRYKKYKHAELKIGDIVLVKEPLTKRAKYPRARIIKLNKNDVGEVSSVIIQKGKTREELHRHVSTIIPILSAPSTSSQNIPEAQTSIRPLLPRASKTKALKSNHSLFNH